MKASTHLGDEVRLLRRDLALVMAVPMLAFCGLLVYATLRLDEQRAQTEDLRGQVQALRLRLSEHLIVAAERAAERSQ